MEEMKRYNDFVESRLSDPSSNFDSFIERVRELQENGFDVSRMLTAGTALSSEGGEFGEYVKKIVFQGKEYNEETHNKMVRELGDMLFYITIACNALNVSFEDVVQGNIDKLSARYPDGHFDITRSEKRNSNDS